MKSYSSSSIANIIFFSFSLVFIVTHIVNFPSAVANILIAFMGIVCLSYSILKMGVKYGNIYVIAGGLLFSALLLVSCLYNGNASVDNLLWVWSYMGIAILIYEFDISNSLFFWISFCFNGFILFYALSGQPAADFLSMGSQNNISVYTIFFMSFAFLSLPNREKVTFKEYILAALNLIVIAWTGSRAGILAAGFFVGSLCLYNFFRKKTKKEIVKMLFGGIALSISAIYLVIKFMWNYLAELIYKLGRYGTSSIRTVIWEEYIGGAFDNIGNFLCGPKTTDISYQWLSYYDGNTHNAYLMLHAKFGLIGLSVIFIVLWFTFIKGIKRKQYMLLIVYLTVMIRSLFDWTAFPGLYDVFVWYFVLFCVDRRNNNTVKN